MRPEHAANDGRLFSWSNPPVTGHPGEGFGCRREAIPYVRGKTDYAAHEIIGSLDSTGPKWANWDFISHFFTGGGAGVTLSEIGHLRDIVEQYAYYSGEKGAHRRLTNQITGAARARGEGEFTYEFDAAISSSTRVGPKVQRMDTLWSRAYSTAACPTTARILQSEAKSSSSLRTCSRTQRTSAICLQRYAKHPAKLASS